MSSVGNPVPDTLFVFIDESGNFDFSCRGTRYFVMAGVVALAPLHTATELQSLRYRLLAEGEDVRQFHASEDRQVVRDAVFATIARLDSIHVHVVYGDKARTPQELRSDTALHALFGGALVQHAIATFSSSEYRQTVVVFDQALTKSKQGVFHATLKPQLKALGKPFRLYFQPMIADMNGQLADYMAWSKFVQLERGEQRPWNSVREGVHVSDRDLFASPQEWTTKSDRPD